MKLKKMKEIMIIKILSIVILFSVSVSYETSAQATLKLEDLPEDYKNTDNYKDSPMPLDPSNTKNQTLTVLNWNIQTLKKPIIATDDEDYQEVIEEYTFRMAGVGAGLNKMYSVKKYDFIILTNIGGNEETYDINKLFLEDNYKYITTKNHKNKHQTSFLYKKNGNYEFVESQEIYSNNNITPSGETPILIIKMILKGQDRTISDLPILIYCVNFNYDTTVRAQQINALQENIKKQYSENKNYIIVGSFFEENLNDIFLNTHLWRHYNSEVPGTYFDYSKNQFMMLDYMLISKDIGIDTVYPYIISEYPFSQSYREKIPNNYNTNLRNVTATSDHFPITYDIIIKFNKKQ